MEGYSVYPILWDYKKNKRNLYRIKIAVGIPGGETTWLLTPHLIGPHHWDKQARKIIDHPNARTMNADLRRRVTDKEAELLVALNTGQKINRESIKGKAAPKSFFDFARATAKKVKNKKGETGTDPLVEKELNRLEVFGGKGILLTDLDVTFLREYNDHEKDREMAQNTRNTTFKFLRRVITMASAEKLIRENPFDAFDIPEYVQGDTVYLVEEEKQALFGLFKKLSDGPLYNTLVHFLCACYSGFRHSDWGFDPYAKIHEGFLRLRPHKRSTGFVVLPIGPTLSQILDRVKRLRDHGVRPFANQTCNDHLKALFIMAEVELNGRKQQGIQKEGTTHVGRHSFGYQCASLGIPKSTTAELMGISVQTVEVYYHLSGDNIMKQAAVMGTI